MEFAWLKDHKEAGNGITFIRENSEAEPFGLSNRR
jgi:hypothetical protein